VRNAGLHEKENSQWGWGKLCIYISTSFRSFLVNLPHWDKTALRCLWLC